MNLNNVIRKHLTKLIRWLSFQLIQICFKLFILLRFVLTLFANNFSTFITKSISCGNHNSSFKIFFPRKRKRATHFFPSFISKYFLVANSLFTSLKPLNVFFSSTTPYSLIVKQYFFLELETN